MKNNFKSLFRLHKISSNLRLIEVLTSLSTKSKNSIPPFSGVKSPTNPRYNADYDELEFW